MWSKDSNSKKTILNIVFVYLFTTISLLLSITYIYYNFTKNQHLDSLQKESNIRATQIIEELENLHFEYQKNDFILYPSYKDIKSNIYDIDKKPIFQEFDMTEIDFDTHIQIVESNIYFIYKVEPHYLGASYLVIKQNQNKMLKSIKTNIMIWLAVSILILFITSFIIAKILIKPLQSNIRLLDNFIKDTTHELNTPISAILNNIEMLDAEEMSQNNSKKIHRIKIASTTISTIYDDLSFLLLNHKKQSNSRIINISEILINRIEYFQILLKSKKLNLKYDIKDDITLFIDKLKFERLIDNLISNAIKYSLPNSKIDITLDKNSFTIEDFGVGISKDNIKEIFTRYKRFDIDINDVGGFGIGYSIIKSIVDEYNIDIDISSKINQGTKVILTWEK